MDAGVEIDETSPCWTFFNMAIAQKNKIGPSEPLSEEFALTQKSSWLLSGLASFLRPPGSVTGAKNFYDIATSTTTKLNQRFEQTRDLISNPPHAIGQEGSRDTPELMRAYGQDMRSYGLSLTVALIMNGVLSMHDPSSNHLICARRHHSKEVLSLATEAAVVRHTSSRSGPALSAFISAPYGQLIPKRDLLSKHCGKSMEQTLWRGVRLHSQKSYEIHFKLYTS